MRIERTVRNEFPAADVYAMSTSREFQERKCHDAGAVSYSVTVEDGPDGAVVRTRRRMPTSDFPALLRKFVPAGVTATEVITWGPPAADGSRTAALAVEFAGSPATMQGTIKIVPDGPGASVVLVDADFRAHVPLIARKIEGAVAPIILRMIDSEEATGRAWALERH